MPVALQPRRLRAIGAVCVLLDASHVLLAQERATIEGRVRDAAGGGALRGAIVLLDGTALQTRTDSSGEYRLVQAPAGPQTLIVRALGYAAARVPVIVTSQGTMRRDVELARTALEMPQMRVTAEGIGRARGELGTASVINQDAIRNQNAVSLAGVLELIPGTVIQPPGLESTQQVSLRAVPTTYGVAERAAAFGTLIIMDGVPLSNNANLQTAGPRGELPLSTAAGGGIDLRRIPAAMLERVEVIRGVPSARYGDLTSGAIVIDTRAGVFAPDLTGRFDPSTNGLAFGGGRTLQRPQTLTLTTDLTRSFVAPGVRNAAVWRGAVNLAHRVVRGDTVNAALASRVLDTRLNVTQVYKDEPEERLVRPDVASSDRSGSARLVERLRIGRADVRHVEVTASLEHEWQTSRSRLPRIRGAEPFTDRLTPGTSVGRYVAGGYVADVALQGRPWHLYVRSELNLPGTSIGAARILRAGLELRRDWTGGAGYQFDIAYPPQVAFNGVNGYDRPRPFDDIPAVAASAAYVDVRLSRALGASGTLDAQAGMRLDVLHEGGWWIGGARDAVAQPRLNLELSPRRWLRLRTGAGLTAKQPGMAELFPAPQWFDVVNVNWYPPDPRERLAVLTTSIVDPGNPSLGYATALKREAGFELDLGTSGAALTVTAFREDTRGGIAWEPSPLFLPRARFVLSDTTIGSGRPPTWSPTASAIDTVPILVDVPRNLNEVRNSGIEWTLSLPELEGIRTRAEISGAATVSRLQNDAIDIGPYSRVAQFQQDGRQQRAPYWRGDSQKGERTLATTRLIHHQPRLGLVLTATVQHYFHERTVQGGATDTLGWSGYITRTGTIVPVPGSERSAAQYRDLRQPRQGLASIPASPPSDWFLSVQLTKSVLRSGRLSFYAFNTLDRLGQPSTNGRAARLFPRSRFGLEATLPLSRSSR